MKKFFVCLLVLFLCSISSAQEQYGGIGVILTRQMNGCLMIYDMATGGPAESSGIKKGDLLEKVNDMPVRKNSMKSLTDILKGPIGTTVTLHILRNNRQMIFNVPRQLVKLWSKKEILSDNKKEGFVKLRDINGYIYEAKVRDGLIYGPAKISKPNGEVIKYNSYSGHVDPASININYPDGSTYKGPIAEEVPHGEGVLYLPDNTKRTGKWIYGQFVDGCYSGDCENGKGVQIGEDFYKYSGGFKDGKEHGYGEFEYINGDEVKKLIGNFKNDYFLSPGEIQFRNGDRYKGEHKNYFKPNGRGVMHFANGDYYEGEWQDGQMTGFGLLIKKNGDHYAGYLKDGKPDGMVAGRVNGRMFYHHYENGQIKQSHEDYTGRRLSNVNAITDDDLLFRICILASENRSSNGPLYGDCENGNGISKVKHWQVYKGPFKNGLPHGEGELFFGNESQYLRVYKGNFKEGKMHGQMQVCMKGKDVYEEAFYEGEHNWLWGSKTFAQLDTEKKEKEEKIKQEYKEASQKYMAEHRESLRRFDEQVEANKRAGSGSGSGSGSSNDDGWRKSSYDVVLSGDGENGYASIAFGNGDSYQGNVKNGLFHGQGQLEVKSSGKSYNGEFYEGNFHGSGTIYDKWGNKLRAQFEYGRLVSGKAYNPDGCHVYTATYRNDVPASYSFQSKSCSLYFGEKEQEPASYSGGSTGRSTWKQETIYYNKGTKDQWSIRIPVRTRR